MPILKIKDETAVGKLLNEIQLQFETEYITVEELIMQRVHEEVERFNKLRNIDFKGLVQPTETERVLNGYRMKNFREIDPEKQAYVALKAFKKNAFFIMVDEQQAVNVEDKILVSEDTKVQFIKLVPLVGG